MRLIGICGLQGSGKNTLGEMITSALAMGSIDIYQKSFAANLKDATALMYGFDREMLEGTTPESREQREIVDSYWGVTPRQALQDVGIAMRNLDKDFWVKSLASTMGFNKYNIITDLRFPNEADFIKGHGGWIIRVVRGEQPAWSRNPEFKNVGCTHTVEKAQEIMGAVQLPHESEWRSECYDFPVDQVILNNGTMHGLQEVANAIAEDANATLS